MAKSRSTISCPSCAARLPTDSRFCPQCGTQLEAGETLELNPYPVHPDRKLASAPASTRSPLSVHRAYQRLLGAHPVPVLGAFGSIAFLVAIVLLASGSLVGGLVLLVLATGLFTLFVGGVRREPDAPAAGHTLWAADRLRSMARLARVSSAAWIHAGVEWLRIRRRQHQLRSKLRASLRPLGEAIHHDDDTRARALKRQAADLERELIDAERRASAAIDNARETIEQERIAIQATDGRRPSDAP